MIIKCTYCGNTPVELNVVRYALWNDNGSYHIITIPFFSSPVGSLCHTPGVVRRPSSVVRRLSSVSSLATKVLRI